ncbi:MAG TPA: GntR family transcriptional regulator [Burkholderiaceae bacterium]|nr:GntR family transcriptional regulator [Burkholderiaceae bacterium]
MPPSLKPVKRQAALGDQVYQALQTHLRSGAIVAGQPLQEVQLAERLGVSRTPVREAMMRLSSEGLLSTVGRSYVVPALTIDDVDEIYEIRFLVEPAALRRVAARTRDAAVRAPIDAALADAIAADAADDAARFRDAAARFRGAWLALVPNARLVRVVEQYADHMQQIRVLTLDDAGVRAIVLRGLEGVAAALAKGDGERAAAAMEDNLREARKAFIAAAALGDAPPPGAPAPVKTQADGNGSGKRHAPRAAQTARAARSTNPGRRSAASASSRSNA